MKPTLLDIEVISNFIKLIPGGMDVDFPLIERQANRPNIANLRRQLSFIKKKTDNAPITVVTMPAFLVLYDLLSYNELAGHYGVSVLGYSTEEVCAKIKDHILDKDNPVLCGHKYHQPITVDHIFYDDKATVVFWTDGTKTIVKCAEGTKYDEYAAFCIALAKKIYGSNSALKRAIKNHARYSKKRQIIKTLCGKTSKDVKQGDTFVIVNEEDNDA